MSRARPSAASGSFDPRTVELLLSVDAHLSDLEDGVYVDRDFNLLGRAAAKRIRSATPADTARARLLRSAARDQALSRYKDKARVITLMISRAEVPLDETLGDLLRRMTHAGRAEAEAIIARVGPRTDIPSGQAAVTELARLYRIEHYAQVFASTCPDPGAAAEAGLLTDLCQLRRVALDGGPTWGISITADEAAAALDDLRERHPAEPAA